MLYLLPLSHRQKVKFRPLLWPAAVVTYSVVEPLPAGITAVICVVEFTVKLLAALPPNRTEVAPVKFVPVIVTEVPPAGQTQQCKDDDVRHMTFVIPSEAKNPESPDFAHSARILRLARK